MPLSFKSFIDSLEIILAKQWEDLSEKTIERTKWIILDTAVAAWDGLKSDELKEYVNSVGSKMQDDKRYIPIIGTEYYTSPNDSLLLHGTAIVSNELDEGNQFAKGHPAAHILAPAYLTAIEEQSSGKEFIRAFILGYEISARFAYACNMNDDMHPHGTWGTIGGAVAAGILKGKTKEALIDIILLAASLPLATSWEAAVTGQTVRNLYTGLSSQIAYQVIAMQTSGFKSSQHVVEHLWGTLISNKVNDQLFAKDLWAPPLVDKSFFKYYPTCRFTHSTIDALYNLASNLDVDIKDIKEVTVETYRLAARLTNNRPENKLSAKFAIPYLTACILLKRNLFDVFSEEALKDEEVLALAKKILVKENIEMTKALPEERAAKITITLHDGTKQCDEIKDASGSFKEPLSTVLLTEKYANMLQDQQKVENMVQATIQLDEAKDIMMWLKEFRPGRLSIHESTAY